MWKLLLSCIRPKGWEDCDVSGEFREVEAVAELKHGTKAATAAISDHTTLEQRPPPRREHKIHLTAVLDASYSMEGRPFLAVVRSLRQLLRVLHPDDSITVWLFSEGMVRAVNCEVRQFLGKVGNLGGGMRPPSAAAHLRDQIWLYDAIIAAIEDLEKQGSRNDVLKPLIVFSDYHATFGPSDASEAKRAVLWTELPQFYPVLMSARDDAMFTDIKQVTTREVFVEDTSDSQIKTAFQLASEHLKAIFRQHDVFVTERAQ